MAHLTPRPSIPMHVNIVKMVAVCMGLTCIIAEGCTYTMLNVFSYSYSVNLYTCTVDVAKLDYTIISYTGLQ